MLPSLLSLLMPEGLPLGVVIAVVYQDTRASRTASHAQSPSQLAMDILSASAVWETPMYLITIRFPHLLKADLGKKQRNQI